MKLHPNPAVSDFNAFSDTNSSHYTAYNTHTHTLQSQVNSEAVGISYYISHMYTCMLIVGYKLDCASCIISTDKHVLPFPQSSS